MYDGGRSVGFNWTHSNGLYTIFMESETSFVLDGVPYAHNYNETTYTNLEYESSFTLGFWTGTRVCEDVIRWENMSIDPFLGIIFNGEPDLSQPPSPTNSKKRLSTGASVGIAIGVIAIVGAAIAIAVVSTKVTAVQHFFRPFSARTDREASARLDTGARSSNAGWTATKPVSGVKNTL